MLGEYEKAPEVTRERLYLEAVESVYANSNKLLMDVEGGNNLIYLPLDQLIKQRPMTGNPSIVQDRLSPEVGMNNSQSGLNRSGRGRGTR